MLLAVLGGFAYSKRGPQPAEVQIAKVGGSPVAAGSVLNLMTLAAGYGDEVIISAEGEGAEAAVEAVAELVATDLDA